MMDPFPITTEHAGLTLAAVLRARLPGQSWNQVRQLVAARRVKVGGDVCLDPARRLSEAEGVELLARPAPVPSADRSELTVRHLDDHVVVVEKPAGLNTVRHPAERDWPARRRELSPTLDDRLQHTLAARLDRPARFLPRLRVVHRLDKETSGLVVFARTPAAERELGRQFHAHTVVRRYLAVVPGYLPPRTIRTQLVRDRGDGRRGSTELEGVGKEAVTHVAVVERLAGYTVLGCRLETGRTHQIRIHLAEAGHPVCGERVYNRRPGGEPTPDPSGAPRLA